MKKLTIPTLVAGALAAGLWGIASAQDSGARADATVHHGRRCSEKMLRGSYLFAATGFNIVGGVAQPKAIHEGIEFNGDGTLTVLSVSLSLNGIISHPPGGSAGDYTVDEDCRGTLVFTGGPSFDIVVQRQGDTVWMFQTNPNTVFQGTAIRFNR